MYILIKRKQISHVTCKLIFMISSSDLLIAIFVQNLVTAVLYDKLLTFFSRDIFFGVSNTFVNVYYRNH